MASISCVPVGVLLWPTQLSSSGGHGGEGHPLRSGGACASTVLAAGLAHLARAGLLRPPQCWLRRRLMEECLTPAARTWCLRRGRKQARHGTAPKLPLPSRLLLPHIFRQSRNQNDVAFPGPLMLGKPTVCEDHSSAEGGCTQFSPDSRFRTVTSSEG